MSSGRGAERGVGPFGRPNGRGTFGGRGPSARGKYVSIRERQENIAAAQQNGEHQGLRSPTTAVGELSLEDPPVRSTDQGAGTAEKKITRSDLAAMKVAKRPRSEKLTDAQVAAKRPKRVTTVPWRGQAFTTSTAYNNQKIVDTEVIEKQKRKLQRFLDHMERYARNQNDHSLGEIRKILNELAVEKRLNLVTLKAAGFMDDDGIKQYLNTSDRFPPDVLDDAAALFVRWNHHHLISGDLMHGLERRKQTDEQDKARHQWVLEPGYPKRESSVEGDNGLFVGQWWPSQLAAWRDGAHGSQQSGISWKAEIGAVSVVISGGYEDEDHGESVWYCGTRQSNQDKLDELTLSTRMMDLAQINSTQIRVLRAAGKTKKDKTPYRPIEGIRYDGLYRIEQKQIAEASTNLWKYLLRRCPEQSPIRDRNGPLPRPTTLEIAAFNSIKDHVFIYQ